MAVNDATPSAATNTAEREFAITRVFDAPRDLVFKAYTESERKTFEAGRDSMQEGFKGTLEQLADYLAKA
jgi:uncharacterized protein YndB with AHSA1/START domain